MPLPSEERDLIRSAIDSMRQPPHSPHQARGTARVEHEVFLQIYKEAYLPRFLAALESDPDFVRLLLLDTLGQYLGTITGEYGSEAGDAAIAMEILGQIAMRDQESRRQIENRFKARIQSLAVSLDNNVRSAASTLMQIIWYGKPFSFEHLIRRIRTLDGCTVVIGAGFSYDSYAPLQQETDLMLSNALSKIDERFSREWMNDHEREAWSVISANPDSFKKIFASSISNKIPSSQHYQLAELFAIGVVKNIVDFNWDNLLERAYEERTGSIMPKIVKDGVTLEQAVWKQHGDVDDLAERWVFPFEDGRIFETVKERVLASPGIVIIIGYSEQERIVRSQLLEKLEAKTEVYRFGPNIDTSRGMRHNAKQVMGILYDSWGGQINTIRSVWEARARATGTTQKRGRSLFRGIMGRPRVSKAVSRLNRNYSLYG